MVHEPGSGNRLLRALPSAAAKRIVPHLEPVELDVRYVLERPRRPIERIYFPDRGIASIVANAGSDRRVEVGIFGRDGVSGLAALMGGDRSPYECFMQMPGAGRAVDVGVVRSVFEDDPAFRGLILRYAQTYMMQATHTALANAQASLSARLCRWLLMCHDRVDGLDLKLTHEFLSTMIGVRRAGVTTTIHDIEGRGLIRARRGWIRIEDRAGLKAEAQTFYGTPEEEYARLMGVDFREG